MINFDVRDNSGEIRIIAFNKYTEKLNLQFKIGDIIQLSNGLLKPKDKQWCPLNHPFTFCI